MRFGRRLLEVRPLPFTAGRAEGTAEEGRDLVRVRNPLAIIATGMGTWQAIPGCEAM